MRCLAVALAACLLLSGCMLMHGTPHTVMEYRQSDTTLRKVGKTLVNLPFWTLDIGFSAALVAGYLWIRAQASPYAS